MRRRRSVVHPGERSDEAWLEATRGAEVYYNVHRWYMVGTGRYGSADPLRAVGDFNPYRYAMANPAARTDSLGLLSTPVEYHPIDYYRPNVCGPGRLGCFKGPWRGTCRCKSVKRCWWFARAGVSIGPLEIYYADNCDDPDEIIEHEQRHAELFEESYEEAQDSARELGRERFVTKAACEEACKKWRAGVEREFSPTRYFGHMLLDLFSFRGCKKWF